MSPIVVKARGKHRVRLALDDIVNEIGAFRERGTDDCNRGGCAVIVPFCIHASRPNMIKALKTQCFQGLRSG